MQQYLCVQSISTNLRNLLARTSTIKCKRGVERNTRRGWPTRPPGPYYWIPSLPDNHRGWRRPSVTCSATCTTCDWSRCNSCTDSRSPPTIDESKTYISKLLCGRRHAGGTATGCHRRKVCSVIEERNTWVRSGTHSYHYCASTYKDVRQDSYKTVQK